MCVGGVGVDRGSRPRAAASVAGAHRTAPSSAGPAPAPALPGIAARLRGLVTRVRGWRPPRLSARGRAPSGDRASKLERQGTFREGSCRQTQRLGAPAAARWTLDHVLQEATRVVPVLHPEGRFVTGVNLVILLLVLLSAILVPLRIAFELYWPWYAVPRARFELKISCHSAACDDQEIDTTFARLAAGVGVGSAGLRRRRRVHVRSGPQLPRTAARAEPAALPRRRAARCTQRPR